MSVANPPNGAPTGIVLSGAQGFWGGFKPEAHVSHFSTHMSSLTPHK